MGPEGRRESTGPANSDDISRQLFLHSNSFSGVDAELRVLESLVDDIDELGPSRVVQIAFGHRRQRERAVHRLVLLGVVADYTVDYGSKEFGIALARVDAATVTEAFLAFIDRSQPGRREGLEQQIRAADWAKPRDAVLGCGALLIAFVYDTVERARRRSLREILLAARESKSEEEFRRRILDYLQEGDVSPRLEALVERPRFGYKAWLAAFREIGTSDDAQEWRGGTARLLASYPDNPGLLLARAYAEALVPAADLAEVVSNVSASLRSAGQRFDVDPDEQEAAVRGVVEMLVVRRHPDAAAAVLLGAGALAPASVERLTESTADACPDNPAVLTMLHNNRMRHFLEVLDGVIDEEINS